MSPGQNPAVPPVPVAPANAASAAVPTNPVGRPSPLTVARRRELQQRFERAWSGLRNGSASVDDVHAWIAPCVVEDPASALYVDTLLLNLRRTDGSKKGRWLVRGWHQAQLAAAALRQQWREVLAKGPDVLRGDAAHPPTLWSLVDAAHASGYRESAWRYAEEALRVAPESPETWHRCARTLAARGQFARAAEFWQRITATRAGDAEAQRMLGALHAVTGKKPPPSTDNSQSSPAKPSSSTPGVSTSGASAAGASAAGASAAGASAAGASADAASVVSASAVGDSPHGDWAVSAAEPATVEACLGRLETLRGVAAWEDAERLLRWAGSRLGRNLRLEEAGEELMLARHAEQAARAESLAQIDADPAWPLLAAETHESLARLETEIWAARALRHPREPRPQAEVARRLSARGDWSQALSAWEETVGRCDHRTPLELAGEAWLMLAESRQRLRRFEDARQAYRKVVELADLAASASATAAKSADLAAVSASGAITRQWETLRSAACEQLKRLDIWTI